ncbi:MAG: hypothetical protein ACK5PS_19385, partial [Desulfopila sp.]
GTLNHATDLEFKLDLRNFLEWIVDQTEKCGADIQLNAEVNTRFIKEFKPDALIVAVGGTPLIPDIPGVDMEHVHWAGDVDCGRLSRWWTRPCFQQRLHNAHCVQGLAWRGYRPVSTFHGWAYCFFFSGR